MNFKRLCFRITILVVLLGILTDGIYAIMPPDVYKKAIQNSPIKVVAIVKKVTIVEQTKYYIEKKVEFELVRSYGVIKPSKIFYGHCKSATENKLVGGTIYYYPEVETEVFVTLDGVGSGDDSGDITSFTLMNNKLGQILEKIGLDGLDYGIGKVVPIN